MRYLLSDDALSPVQRRRDQHALNHYAERCADFKRLPLPADQETLRLFLADRFDRISRYTLDEYVNAITRWHLDRGQKNPFASPLLQALLRVSRRACRVRRTELPQARAICDVIDAIPKTDKGLRDTAMQLLSYCTRASARGLSELNRSDVIFAGPGMRVLISRAHGVCDVPVTSYEDARYCPVAAMERYLQLIDDGEPALFRTFNNGFMTTRRLSPGGAAAALSLTVRALKESDGITRLGLRKRAIVSAANRRATDEDIRRQFGYSQVARVRHWIRLHGGRRSDIVQKLGL
jgi:hypothetical protein